MPSAYEGDEDVKDRPSLSIFAVEVDGKPVLTFEARL
jgi:hypothetical protein